MDRDDLDREVQKELLRVKNLTHTPDEHFRTVLRLFYATTGRRDSPLYGLLNSTERAALYWFAHQQNHPK